MKEYIFRCVHNCRTKGVYLNSDDSRLQIFVFDPNRPGSHLGYLPRLCQDSTDDLTLAGHLFEEIKNGWLISEFISKSVSHEQRRRGWCRLARDQSALSLLATGKVYALALLPLRWFIERRYWYPVQRFNIPKSKETCARYRRSGRRMKRKMIN